MREAFKMTLTLFVIGIICGLLLSTANGVTAPIINERQEQEFLAALEGFFPDVSRFEVEEVGKEEFYLCRDAAEQFLGVVGKVKANGYDGEIIYDLAVSAAGDIVGIRIVSHGETAGIGDVILKPDFQERLIGLNFADPIIAGQDVDLVTGATKSTGGMVSSVRRVMDLIGENFFCEELETAVEVIE